MKHELYIRDSVSDNDGPIKNSFKSEESVGKYSFKNLIEMAQQLRAKMSVITK